MIRPIAGFTLRLALVIVLLVLLILGLANHCFGQGVRFDSIAQSSSTVGGITVATPVSGATVTVCTVTGISTATEIGTTVTVTTAATHNLTAGQAVTVYGVSVAGYNGNWTVATTPLANTFTFITAAGLGAGTGGAVAPNNKPCTPAATLYTNQSLGTSGPNPISTDSQGNFGFWASAGTYVYTITGSGIAGALFYVTPTTSTYLPDASTDIGTSTWRPRNIYLSGTVRNGTATMGLTQKAGTGIGNYTTLSAVYVDVDGTNLSHTVTIPVGWKLQVTATANMQSLTAPVPVLLSLYDGATIPGSERQVSGSTTISQVVTSAVIIAGDGASHTIKLQYRTTNAADAAVLTNGAAGVMPVMNFLLIPSN